MYKICATCKTPKVMILLHILLYTKSHDFATLEAGLASCADFVDVLLYTTSHDFATLEAGLSFGCDSVRYTSVKKVYVFDCNSDVGWCFASCTDFEHFLLYTTIHDFATSELQSNTYTFFTEVYLTESQPKDSPASNVAGLSFGCD